MSKNPCFRTPFHSQHVKQSEKLHRSTFIILFHHFWKMSVLVISEILRLFVFTADGKCSLRNSSFFRNQFKRNYIWTFSKKKWPSQFLYFRHYRLRKTRLLKCLKSPVSQHFSTVNLLKSPKHCWKFHHPTFIILFCNSGKNWGRRYLP